MTEAAFQRQVLQLARLLGWRTAHFRAAQTSGGRWLTPVQGDGAGWPDLVLVRASTILFVELKSDRGRLSPEQSAWLEALAVAGCQVSVWRPRDWAEVERRLKEE